MKLARQLWKWVEYGPRPAPPAQANPPAQPLHPQSLHADERGATMLEWALILATIGIPSYFLFKMAMDIMVEHYKLVTTLNALPLP